MGRFSTPKDLGNAACFLCSDEASMITGTILEVDGLKVHINAKIIGILGDIGSGKSFVAKQFGCPVFNADQEVNKLYKKDRSCYIKLNYKLPKFIKSIPINKIELGNAILANKKNLKKIVNIVHPIIRKK